MTLCIANVLTRKKEPFVPVQPGKVGIYVCGVTVYDRCHVGHLRSYLSFDAIIRYLDYKGYQVRYVRNFTDIDDKIIARAAEIAQGPAGAWRSAPAYADYDEARWRARLEEDAVIRDKAERTGQPLPLAVADHFIDVFHNEDFAPFELFPASAEPRVSRHIDAVVAMIGRIIDNGFAYVVDGDVYFDVDAYHRATGEYGRLSGRDYTQMMEGARVQPGEKKRRGADFALWKAAAPGEPAWESPWGPGRPGWHIECSAMSEKELGCPFDIHGGGKDLIFPHHENEIAQAKAAGAPDFAAVWMHNGFVTVDGVKMSKSLGNFVTIADALRMAPPEVWRLVVLSSHYASPIDFSRTKDGEAGTVRGTVDIAFDRLEYFYETLAKADERIAAVPDAPAEAPDGEVVPVLARFEEAMDDDFNTPRALVAVGDGMKTLNELCAMRAKEIKKYPGGKAGHAAAVRALRDQVRTALKVLHLCTAPPQRALEALRDFAAGLRGIDKSQVEALIAERTAARAAKDWAESDRIRDVLSSMGVEVQDGPAGTTWKVRRT